MATCTVSGTLYDLGGSAISGVTIRYTSASPTFDGSSNLLLPKEISTTTDTNGDWSLVCVQGTSGDFIIEYPQNSSDSTLPYYFPAIIPSESTATFAQVWMDPPGLPSYPFTFSQISGQLTESQMPTLPAAEIWVGSASNVAAAVAVSGDITITSAGATTVAKIQGTTVSGTTGTGNVVFSASPTLTGTLAAAAGTFSSTLGVSNYVTITKDANTASAPANAQLHIRGSSSTTKKLDIGMDTSTNYGMLSAETAPSTYVPIALNPNGGGAAIGATTPDIFSRSYGGTILGISGASSQSALAINSATGTAYLEMGVGGTRTSTIQSDGSNFFIRSVGSVPMTLGTNNGTALTIDTSQNATFAGYTQASYFSTANSNPAGTGIIRFANNEGAAWRNAANSANYTLVVDSSNQLNFNSGAFVAGASGTVGASTSFVAPFFAGYAGTVSTTGVLRLANADRIAWRNTTNSADIYIDVNASNQFEVHGGAMTVDTSGSAAFAGAVSHPLGSVSAPTVTFTGDSNTGIYSSGADNLDFTTGGTNRINVNSSGDVTFTGQVVGKNGTTSAPGFRFTTESNTGLYRDSGNIGFAVAGTKVGAVSSAGLQLTAANGIYATAANSNLFFSGDTGSGSGGEIKVYGSSHATKANYTETLANGSVKTTVTATGLGVGMVPSNTLDVTGTFGTTGNASVGGTLGVTGATTLSSTLAVTGAATLSNAVTQGNATAVTGTASASGTAVTGTSTLFRQEFQVGDSITIAGQTQTVTSIGSNTSITVGSAFSGTPSGAITRTSASTSLFYPNGRLVLGGGTATSWVTNGVTQTPLEIISNPTGASATTGNASQVNLVGYAGAATGSTLATALNFWRAGGNESSPSSPASGDVLGQITWRGQTAAGTFTTGAYIRGQTTEAFGAAAAGSKLVFATTPNTTTTATTALTLDQDLSATFVGNITANSATSAHTFGVTTDSGSAKTTLTVQGSTTGYTNATGVFVKAGTSSSDYSMVVANAANSANHLVVYGNAKVTTKNNTIDDGSGNATFSTDGTSISVTTKLGVTGSTVGTQTTAMFENRDYTASNKNFIRVRQQATAGGGYSAYLGEDQAGLLYLSNDSTSATHLTMDTSGRVGIGTSSLFNSQTMMQVTKDQTGTGANATTLVVSNPDATNAGDVALRMSVAALGWYMGIDNSDSDRLKFGNGSTTWDGTGTALTLDSSNNVVVGNAALATNATNGFLYIDSCAGTPTGAPTSFTGRVPLVYDTTNNKLYVYNGAWKSVTLA